MQEGPNNERTSNKNWCLGMELTDISFRKPRPEHTSTRYASLKWLHQQACWPQVWGEDFNNWNLKSHLINLSARALAPFSLYQLQPNVATECCISFANEARITFLKFQFLRYAGWNGPTMTGNLLLVAMIIRYPILSCYYYYYFFPLSCSLLCLNWLYL